MKGTRRAVARERERPRVCTGCGAVSHAAVSCRVQCSLRVRGAVRCHVSGRSLPPSPEGVTPTAARTALCLLLPVRSCREGPQRFGSILLDSLGSRRPGVSVPSRAPVIRLLSASGNPQAFVDPSTRNQPVSSRTCFGCH